MVKKDYKHFKKHFPHYDAYSVEDLVYALDSCLPEVNDILMALSHKKGAEVFIDFEDSSTLEGLLGKTCFGVSILVRTGIQEWDYLPSIGCMEET